MLYLHFSVATAIIIRVNNALHDLTQLKWLPLASWVQEVSATDIVIDILNKQSPITEDM
jgi:hypothetical protein